MTPEPVTYPLGQWTPYKGPVENEHYTFFGILYCPSAYLGVLFSKLKPDGKVYSDLYIELPHGTLIYLVPTPLK